MERIHVIVAVEVVYLKEFPISYIVRRHTITGRPINTVKINYIVDKFGDKLNFSINELWRVNLKINR